MINLNIIVTNKTKRLKYNNHEVICIPQILVIFIIALS